MSFYSKLFHDAINNTDKDFGQNVSNLFLAWRDADPSTSSFKDLVEKFVGKPDNENLYDALGRAMDLADESNENHYHNQHHNREVFLMTLALLKKHNDMNAEPKIKPDLAWTTLCAALIHDYGHDGGTNNVDGKVVSMRLEKQSVDLAKENMSDLNLNALFWRRISMMILPTDITSPGVGLPSPAAELKQIFVGHMNKTPVYRDDITLFAPLRRSPELTMCALILSDADLSTSAGLCIDIAKNNTLSLYHESNGKIAYSPQSLQGFVKFVCDGFPATPAGKELLSAGLQEINTNIANDINNGVSYEI